MKLLGSTEKKINKNKNGENITQVENTEVVLVHCNIVNSNYQHDSRDLYTSVPNKILWPIVRYFTQKFLK